MTFRDHQPVLNTHEVTCGECFEDWPCPTRFVVVEVADAVDEMTDWFGAGDWIKAGPWT